MNTRYTFNALEENKNTSVVVDIDDAASWTRVLQEFAQFLGSVYGYDITDKIVVKRSKFNGEEEETLLGNI